MLFFLCSQWCFAGNIAVLVYVEDPPEFTVSRLIETKTYFSENFPEIDLRVIHLVRIRKAEIERQVIEEKVAALNLTNEKITTVMFATHGGSSKTETILGGLGNFNTENKPFEGLETLFASLKPHLSDHLSIVMNACSTMSGGNDFAIKRIEALSAWLKQFGVNEIWVWGALRRMAPRAPGRTYLAHYLQPKYFLGALVLGAITGTGFFYQPGQSIGQTLLQTFLGTAWNIAAFSALYRATSSDQGLLVHVAASGTQTEDLALFKNGFVQKTFCTFISTPRPSAQ